MSGSGVMNAVTSVDAGSAPVAAKRTRSRSVRMPSSRPLSTTSTEPTRRCIIRPAASAIDADGPTVSTCVLIMSATVSALITPGMRRPGYSVS